MLTNHLRPLEKKELRIQGNNTTKQNVHVTVYVSAHVCVCESFCLCLQAHCVFDRNGCGVESGVQFDRQPPWAHWPPVMTAGQRQKQATALGASGFAYKMLLWPDLAFMGNPLNSDPFKLKWTFLAGTVAPRSQIICMV